MTAPRQPAPPALIVLSLFTTLVFGALALEYVNYRLVLVADVPVLTAILGLSDIWARVGWIMAVWLGLAGALCLWWREDASVLIFFFAAVGGLVALAGVPRVGWVPDLAAAGLAGWVVVVAAVAWWQARAFKIGGYLV